MKRASGIAGLSGKGAGRFHHTGRRTGAVILAAAMTAAGLAGCGSSSGSSTAADTAAAAETVAAAETAAASETTAAAETAATESTEAAAESSTQTTASSGEGEKVVIYTPTEDYLIDYMQQRLDEAFPQYDITISYYHSGDLAAKLQAEGAENTECDIVFDMEYGYLQSLKDMLAKIDFIDASQFLPDMQSEDGTYMPVDRYSGSVIVNTEVLSDKGLDKPESYEDLLKDEYKGMIEMPDPEQSSTGYLFLKSLVNAWGEDEAFDYFDQLDSNILQYTGGGSGPVKDAVAGECAVALSLTFNAVEQINDGAPLEILFFKEGAPYTPAGLSIIKGHETRQPVIDVVKYFYSDIVDDYTSTYLPEPIKEGQVNNAKNYPKDIPYADMSDNTPDVKEALLERWAETH